MYILSLIFIIPLFIYWCANEKIGLQLSIVYIVSAWVINVLQHSDIWLSFHIGYGYIIAAVIFCFYIFFRKRLEALFAKGGFRVYLISTAVASFLMILYRPEPEFVLPGGLLLGLGAGYCLCKRYVGFKSADYLERKLILVILTVVLRILIGLGVLALIAYRVNSFMPHLSENQNIFLYTFLCCAVCGFWITIVAPFVFIKLRLAGIDIKQ
ncbi:MAG: hypothetical protein FWD28_05830 [Treponema sp.]|nr:hypothetical protein [Treponema sp.]